jgi:hypothetical protein
MPSTVGYPNQEVAKGPEGESLLRVARSQWEHGKKYRREHRESVWRRSEVQFGGDHWGQGGGPRDPRADLIVVNISFSTVVTIVPYVTGSDPRFLVEPYSYDATIRNARAQAAYINRFWRSQSSGARRAVYNATHDHLVYGDGYGKVVYEMEDREGPEGDTQTIAEITVHSISPWDLWIDPMADGFHNARWVAQRTRMLLHEVRDEPSYVNTDMIQVGIDVSDGTDPERLPELPSGKDGEENENSWVEVIEFWDLRNRRMIVFTPNSAKPLKVVDEAVCPIVPIENHWLPKSPYHMSDLEQIWSLQQELNKTRSQMITHRRRNIAKYLVRTDALDDGAEQALMSEVVGEVVKIKSNEPLDSVIRPVASLPLSSENYAVSDLITRDVFEITGVNEYLRGATPQIRRTATEASIIEGASNVKAAHKLSRVEEFVRQLGTLVLKIAGDVFPLTDYDELGLYITGKDAEALNKAQQGEHLTQLMQQGAPPEILAREQQGADLYGATVLKLGGDIFVGEYQVEVVQNSTELRDPVFKEQKFREMAASLTNAAPVLAQQGIQVNLRKAYELWFEAAGIQDVDEMFESLPGGMPAAAPQPQAPGPNGLQGVGVPNLQGLGAPNDLLSALNTGAIPPGGQPPPAPSDASQQL